MVKLNRVLIISIIISINFFVSETNGRNLFSKREIELKNLERIFTEAKLRIRNSSESRAGDYLKLLPGITLSRRAPYTGIEQAETYIGLSFSISQIHYINDKMNERSATKRKAFRKLMSLKFKIEKIIKKKYLVKGQVWKLARIRRSMDNPVDIAGIDEKINRLVLKVETFEIDIEDAYAEIEYICIEVER